MAVSAARRNEGIGSRLLTHAERYVLQQGGRYLQVKTVAETSQSAPYAQTRKFYEAKGFNPLEVFPTLWDPRNPALQLVKVLSAA
jgi:GNAT superfamily N-acetyltransferase